MMYYQCKDYEDKISICKELEIINFITPYFKDYLIIMLDPNNNPKIDMAIPHLFSTTIEPLSREDFLSYAKSILL